LNTLQSLIDDVKRRRAERFDAEARNVIEAFVDEIEKNQGKESNFTGKYLYACFKFKQPLLCRCVYYCFDIYDFLILDEQMIITMLDLFLAGSETTSMVLMWAILFLTLNPECQEKLQLEIRDGRERFSVIPMDIASK